MPLRRHRVWPFVAMAFLFRMQLNFVGPPSPQRPQRYATARQWWPKREGPANTPESHQDINSMDIGDVSRWLTTMLLKNYVSKFEDATVDGKLLANLTDEDLQEIGVDHGVHRKKILMRRDELVKQSRPRSSVLHQWRSDRPSEAMIDATKPDLERRQFATGVLNYMRQAGLELGVADEKIIEEVDNIEHNLLEQSIFLDTLQGINAWGWSQTVDQPAGGGVREEIQADLGQIQRAKTALKQRMVVTSANNKQLAVAIISYCKLVNSGKPSNSEKDFASAQLNESVQTWKNKMVEEVAKASFCHQGLGQRASARITGSKLPGGLAAQSNLDEYKRLIAEKEKAAQKCQQIRNLADADLQLALKARTKGGLKEELEVEENEMVRLEECQAKLTAQKQSLEKGKEYYRGLRAQQRNDTKNTRNFHIRGWWRFAWKKEMEVYEEQVQQDEEKRKLDEKSLDKDLEKVDNELIGIARQKEELQKKIRDLKTKDSEKFWKNKLEAEGLLSAEAEVEEIEEKLIELLRQFRELMRKTGVANPDAAANLMLQHEKSRFLLGEASDISSEVATRMNEFISQVEKATVHDLGNVKQLEQLAAALLIVDEEHQKQKRRLQQFKQDVLESQWDSAAGNLLNPTDRNRTA
eukprot:s3979_g3.t1